MEKPNKQNISFLKFLPRATSALSFKNPSFTKLKSHINKGFSGPINFSVLPDDVRTKKSKNIIYDSQGPTPPSPRVSCMGQIKLNPNNKKLKTNANKDNNNDIIMKFKEVKKSGGSTISKLFSRSMRLPIKIDEKGYSCNDTQDKVVHGMPPSLGQIRKFATSKDTLRDFDWTAHVNPVDRDHDC